MRVYKSVRLAYEAKVWLNELIIRRENELKKWLSSVEKISNLEEEIYKNHSSNLNGVSVNLVLRVTSGSVIEEAYRNTRNLSQQEWYDLADEMEASLRLRSNFHPVESITPRLYMDIEVIAGIEEFRYKFRADKRNRLPRLSYIIKLIIFAYYKKIFG